MEIGITLVVLKVAKVGTPGLHDTSRSREMILLLLFLLVSIRERRGLSREERYWLVSHIIMSQKCSLFDIGLVYYMNPTTVVWKPWLYLYEANQVVYSVNWLNKMWLSIMYKKT